MAALRQPLGPRSGLATTPEDLARWAKALYEGRAFTKKETLEAMLTGVDASSGRGGGRGAKYGHGGWFPGYRTEMAYYPERKVAIAIQFNTDIGQSLKKGPSAYLTDVTRVMMGAGK